MKLLSSLSTVLFFTAVISTPVEHSLFARGPACTVPAGSGTCESRAAGGCPGGTFHAGSPLRWPCPGDDDIQCCVKGPSNRPSCTVPAGSGVCASVRANECPGGSFHEGSGPPWPCPGNNNIQCCVTTPGSGNVGVKILRKAMEAAGMPYAWGGGSCNGPSKAQPPWADGEIGYDCSGLVAWAVCQVTGRNLFAEGLRVTRSMYCASESRLRYKKIPFSQRRAGDAVFFGGACDCGNPSTIYHVGLMMDSGDRMWNAPNDQINRVKEMRISGFGKAPCPLVIRF